MKETYKAEIDDIGLRADVFLSEKSGLSRSKIKRLALDGCVLSENGKTVKVSYKVEEGDTLELTVPVRDEPQFVAEDIPLDIVYEDEHLLVVNKAKGMVVHPGRGNSTGTLAAGLLYHCKNISSVGGDFRPGIVHRLDKDTSGLLVCALTDEAHYALSSLLAARKIKRHYTAFVWGHPDPTDGSIDAPIGRNKRRPTLKSIVANGRNALTHYTTESSFEFLTKMNIQLETGRTHQIRIHFAHIGHHIFGDYNYGGRDERLKGFSAEIRGHARRLLKIMDRQSLQAQRLEFVHPVSGENMVFTAPLAADMATLEEYLIKTEQ